MKKIKVIALTMVLVVLAVCAVACGSEKVSVNCTVSVVVNGETVLDGYEYTVQNNVETPPTVLQAGIEVFTMVEYPYETDEDGLTITCLTIDGVEYRAGQAEDGSFGYWSYTADGNAPESGRAGNNAVLEGQHIVFSFQSETFAE